MKIVSFGHRKLTGKDLAAKILIAHLRVKHRGINVIKAGFADKVKSVAYDLYGHLGLMPGDFYEDRKDLVSVKLPVIDKTPREIWIGVGNGLRINVWDSTWFEYLLTRASADILIVKDLRFPVEAEGILARGGKVYRIDRPSVPKENDGADDPLENFDKWTGVIVNDGSIHEFHEKVIAVAEELL